MDTVKPLNRLICVDYDTDDSKRRFVRSLIIEHIKQSGKLYKEKSSRIFAEAYVSICIPNDCVIFCLTDAVEQLRKSGYFRNSVKYHAKRATAVVRNYEKLLMAVLTRNNVHDYFMDFSDVYYEKLKPHIFLLRMSLKSFLDKHDEKDSDMKSYVLLAKIMLHLSVMQFDVFWNTRQGDCDDMRSAFLAARLQGALSAWCSVVEQLPFTTMSNPEEESKDVDMGVQVLITQMNSDEIRGYAGRKALDLNPEYKKRFLDKTEK